MLVRSFLGRMSMRRRPRSIRRTARRGSGSAASATWASTMWRPAARASTCRRSTGHYTHGATESGSAEPDFSHLSVRRPFGFVFFRRILRWSSSTRSNASGTPVNHHSNPSTIPRRFSKLHLRTQCRHLVHFLIQQNSSKFTRSRPF